MKKVVRRVFGRVNGARGTARYFRSARKYKSRSHPLRNLDSQQIESLLQRAGSQFTQCQAAGADGFFRLEHRTGLEIRVKRAGQLEHVIRQQVRSEIFENGRQHLAET